MKPVDLRREQIGIEQTTKCSLAFWRKCVVLLLASLCRIHKLKAIKHIMCACPNVYFGGAPPIISAFCSANLAPTRSECFKNLSVQFKTHCSSLDDNAFDVKSLQHAVKHRSTRFEYILRKSCICFFSMILDMCACSAAFICDMSIL